MAQHKLNQDSPISSSLHPSVNLAIIGLVLTFVAAVWMFFDSDAYGAWLDVVVTGLFVVATAIPVLCWLTWRRNAAGARDGSHPGFHDWVVGEFDTWTGPVIRPGGSAADWRAAAPATAYNACNLARRRLCASLCGKSSYFCVSSTARSRAEAVSNWARSILSPQLFA
jgi:hypothetical protein